MLLAISALSVGLIALALAGVMWWTLRQNISQAGGQSRREVQSLQAALQAAMNEASQSRQRAEDLAASASAARLTAERCQEIAEYAARASQESAEAAQRSAATAAQTVAEASRGAEASAESAKASESSARGAGNAAQAALRAAAAAEACVRIGEQEAQGSLTSAKAAEAAAAAASDSARAAAETAQSNRALAEIGKRAWVHATEFRAALKTQGTENSTLEVRIANLGSTPARELKVSTSFHLEDQVPEELQLKPRATNIVLGPGVSFSISHFLRVSPADLAAITTGRRLLLASGQADYVDVLGIARQTRWCAAYNVNGNSFMPAPKHNLTT